MSTRNEADELKFAVITLLWLIEIVSGFCVPLASPLQSIKLCPVSGTAVSVTDVFVGYTLARGFTLTRPLPLISTVKAAWPAGVAAKMEETVCVGALIVK